MVERFVPPNSKKDHHSRKARFVGLLSVVCVLLLGCCVSGLSLMGLAIWDTEEELLRAYKQDPAIQSRIGEVKSVDMRIVQTMTDRDAEVGWFDVRGTKGSGTLQVRIPLGSGNFIRQAFFWDDKEKLELDPYKKNF